MSKLNVDSRLQQVVGIAKDGHKILGPYKSNGALWQPCEVDICNGVKIGDSYYYVMTSFYPYTIGCWGPSTSQNYATLSCSANKRVCAARNLGDLEYSSGVLNTVSNSFYWIMGVSLGLILILN